MDFPATYYPQKQWTSCVRRRKWIRYRRYSALNSWCAIAPLHKDATQEPFISIAVGGHEGGFGSGRLSVWAVTAHGRLMFRTEVCFNSVYKLLILNRLVRFLPRVNDGASWVYH